MSAARAAGERTLELRYEELVQQPAAAAARLASHLELDEDAVRAALGGAHDVSVGRWRRDLSSGELAEVEDEAGDVLRALGYLEPDASSR